VRTIDKLARIDQEKCDRCGICVRVCPVLAVKTVKAGSRVKTVLIEEDACQACTICATRCPAHAIAMLAREHPFEVGIQVGQVTPEMAQICRKAHFYPDQVVCYCHRVQAKEIVAAVLAGAKTPEEVAQMTGARTGCGVLCITGVIRLLEGAGLKLGKAPGCQWYGNPVTIWDIPSDVKKKYPQYYLEADQEVIDTVFPGGKPE
jgi:NAD-dependent dihydropyrimidine dehydrogenase PreA subunit/bacterioferritin-associated ferredoxin